MTHMKPRAIGVDVGKVIMRDDLGEALMEQLRAHWGVDVERLEEFRLRRWKLDAHRLPAPGQSVEDMEKAFWSDAARTFQRNATPAFFAEMVALTEEAIQASAGILELLDRLARAGICLAVVSNQTPYWAARIVRKLGLTNFVLPDRMVWSYEVGHSKSSASYAMFHAFQRAVGGLPREQLILFDDRPRNIDRAVSFGCCGILVPDAPPTSADYMAAILKAMGILRPNHP